MPINCAILFYNLKSTEEYKWNPSVTAPVPKPYIYMGTLFEKERF